MATRLNTDPAGGGPEAVGVRPAREAPAAADALPGGPPRAGTDDDWRPREPRPRNDDPLLGSLAALTRLLGRPTSVDALIAGLPLDAGPLSPDLAVRAAGLAGLSARWVRRDLGGITAPTLPCLLLLENRGACLLLGWQDGDQARVILPETGFGESTLTRDELAARHAGWVLFARPEVQPQDGVAATNPLPRGTWFWRPVLAGWPIYGEVVLAALMINLFALASPLFVMNVYDRVVPNQALETLWVLAAGVATIFGFDFVLRTLRGYFVDAAGRAADLQLASRIFEQVMGLQLAARPASAGAFANNLREFESLRDFFTSATLVTLVDLPFILLFIAIVALIGGPVALVPAIAVPIVIGLGIVLQIPLNRTVRRTFRESAERHGILVESVHGLETLKSLGAAGRRQLSFERMVAATARSAARARLLSNLTVNVALLAQNLVVVGVVVLGVYRIGEGLLTVGGLVACTIITGRAMAPLAQVAGILTRYHQARAAYGALDAVMALPVERPVGQRFLHRPVLAGEIQFKGVTFTYPGQRLTALDQVSFTIRARERVGLIGRVGSGKTTIEKLILGLYQPDEGAVLLDGTDLRQIDPADLRRNIGAVLQDVFLFQGTIRDNITLGAPVADDAAVLRAARLAGVEEFVARHPQGFDLLVGERGERLSGGQRQAVALARALLIDPPVLLLDEPSSSMDHAAEEQLKARLDGFLAGRTLVLVTHRASLLSLVDRLIVLDGGRVVADGAKGPVLEALASGSVRSSV